MRSADIIEGTAYAVKLPIRAYGTIQGTQILRAFPDARLENGKWRVIVDHDGPTAGAGPTEEVNPHAITQPWLEYAYEKAQTEAIREDEQRAFMARMAAERAAQQADVEGWCHLFAGLPVERPIRKGHDMESQIHEMFVRQQGQTLTFTLEDVKAIARRISALQQEILSSGGGWAPRADAVTDGAREVITLTPKASSTLAALDAAAERALAEAHDSTQDGLG